MATTRYYIARHSTGAVFTRSTQTRTYTHMVAALSEESGVWGDWGWSSSLSLAQANMGRIHRVCDILEAQEVDRKTYEAAKAPEAAEEAAQPLPAPIVPSEPITSREAWLNAFTAASRPHFERVGFPLPAGVRSSIGFTSKGVRSNRIGECWTHTASADGHFEIFLHPSLQSDASRIADILTHELIHAAVGIEAGHGGPFRRCATALGLVGKMTATTAGDAWREWADPILEVLGPLPGADLGAKVVSSAGKKQTTRMLKLECPECGFSCRTTAKHIEAHAVLRCPVGDCEGELITP